VSVVLCCCTLVGAQPAAIANTNKNRNPNFIPLFMIFLLSLA
jgi:hypothetical protein